jgi:putative addiction module component (TIGR02574 family)
MLVEQLEAEILKLPREIRARLAERLISSLDDESENEQAWIEEAERRYRRYVDGETEAVPIDEFLSQLRQDLEL